MELVLTVLLGKVVWTVEVGPYREVAAIVMALLEGAIVVVDILGGKGLLFDVGIPTKAAPITGGKEDLLAWFAPSFGFAAAYANG